MKRVFGSLLVLLSMSVAVGAACGGKPDPAKLKACAEKATAKSDDCSACCKDAGANGHQWTPDRCECL